MSIRPLVLALLALASITAALPAQEETGSGINQIVSNRPGNFNLGTNINTLLGANTFYNAGITGQGTIAANVEAGHLWNGHESLQHVTSFSNHADAWGNTVNDLVDRHATWTAQHIGGRRTVASPGAWQEGIAPGTDLRSGAVATQWNGNAYALSFNFSGNSFDGGYAPHFGTADVINSSWGGTSPAGDNPFAVRLDGYAANNPNTTLVASAGNSGPGSNSVGFPGSGYNAITVAALANGGDNSYNTVANFSSRGPQAYSDPINGTITGLRAAVDIAAPGTNLHAAYYGGQTGGNNPSLTGSPNGSLGGPASYSTSVAGTSFSSPIVAGAVALVKSASYNTPEINTLQARDTRVVKSILQNSATKTVGWNNGQIANANGGVDTSQALDWAAGAGALNLDSAFHQYVNAGTRDIAGIANGNLGLVASVGWDFGNVLNGGFNSYLIDTLLQAGSMFNVTLNWFRDRTYDAFTFNQRDLGQANLNLRIRDLDTDTIISQSNSLFNTTEHLSFLLPRTARYGIEVHYLGNTFGNQTNVDYGLAWSGLSAVPEPGALLVLALTAGVVLPLRRTRS